MKVIYELPKGKNNHQGVYSTSSCNSHVFIFENAKEIWNVKRQKEGK
jgi:hypothetical protein